MSYWEDSFKFLSRCQRIEMQHIQNHQNPKILKMIRACSHMTELRRQVTLDPNQRPGREWVLVPVGMSLTEYAFHDTLVRLQK